MKANKLIGLIAERGLSQAKVARAIGIRPETFYRKIKTGVFGTDEVQKMILLLHIDDPVDIFLDQR